MKKNDKVRCKVVCRDGCEWTCFVSKVGGSLTYRLKTLVGVHTCGRTYKGRMATSRWIADKLADTMKTNKTISLGGMSKHIKKYYCADVTVNRASIARRHAREKMEGDFVEQYAKLWDYCEEVKRTNLGSSLLLLVDRQTKDLEPMFLRMYMCLHGVKTGFLVGCRPVIGLDGCFLKSPFGGILLVAIAKDPNDQYFPLVVAVVECENKDSWTWFMTNLLDDIGRDRRWVFISDQHKVPLLLSKLSNMLVV